MSFESKQHAKKAKQGSTTKRFLLSVVLFLVVFFRKYLQFRAWIILLPLLVILLLMGKLFTETGLLVLSVFVAYLLLSYLSKRFEGYEE
jgi:hypothetical protein